MGLIPVDLVGILQKHLRQNKREPDGLLHCSGDLVGSLRHSMLRAAGAPTIDSDLVEDIVLQTGTFWHTYFGEILVAEGIPFMQEVQLAKYLPTGWSGRADWLFWSDEYKAFVLGDLKTTKGESLRFIRSEGAKTEHIWQLSAYFHALVEMGLPIVEAFAVLYIPKNRTSDKSERIEPILQECEILKREVVWEEMERRWALTSEYLRSLQFTTHRTLNFSTRELEPWFESYVTDQLAPVQEREQKMWWDAKAGIWNVKLVPHWSAAYCPYPTQLCDCSEQGTTKIGHYELLYDEDDGNFYASEYIPRRGYNEIESTVRPSDKEVQKRGKVA